jgi:glyoxylase-like metal-dependent hydrolase (beta-lactamase superfamily II)
MELYPIHAGYLRLDGGAMFGVVPKPVWSRTNPPDERNRITLAMRCLLIQTGGRLALVDNGIGYKFNDKMTDLFGIDHSEHTLEASLAQHGFDKGDITDLIITHLHFDHCGGSTAYGRDGQTPEIAFPNARIWVQQRHLEWALAPNAREVASFLPENVKPIADWPHLETPDGEAEILPGVQVMPVNGHTEMQQLPYLTYRGRHLLYAADLFPTYGHLPLPYVMGYDVRPLDTLDERQRFLPWLVENDVVLFYEHDPYHECGTVHQDEKGKYKSKTTFTLAEL